MRTPNRKITITQSRRKVGPFKRPTRSNQLKGAVAAMAALSLVKSKKRPRRPQRPRAQPGRIHREQGEEFLSFVSVPAASTIGASLFSLEVNPMQLPRLSVFASQYKQWKGTVSMKVESLGNAFSTSSVSLAYVPDPDPNDLPTDPTALLRVVNSAPSQRNLHLQDQRSAVVNASWKLSTNPWKFVQDTDSSDRSNGVFLIVANGSPGAADIPLKVSFKYDISFQGNTYTPLESGLANVTQALYGVNNALSDQLFTPTTGAANWSVAGNSLTLNYPSGSVNPKYYGTWTTALTGLPNAAIVLQVVTQATSGTSSNGRTTITGLSVGATQSVFNFLAITAPTAGTSNSFAVFPRSVGQ